MCRVKGSWSSCGKPVFGTLCPSRPANPCSQPAAMGCQLLCGGVHSFDPLAFYSESHMLCLPAYHMQSTHPHALAHTNAPTHTQTQKLLLHTDRAIGWFLNRRGDTCLCLFKQPGACDGNITPACPGYPTDIAGGPSNLGRATGSGA